MIIDGKEIKRWQKKNEMTSYYFGVLKREIRAAINELPFALVVKVTQSVNTDSIYFKVNISPFDKVITISLRTHPPRQTHEALELFYINDFKTLNNLKTVIKNRIIVRYNNMARANGLDEVIISKKAKKIVTKQKQSSLPTESFQLDEQYIEVLKKAYIDEIIENGWAKLIDVTKILGSRYNISTKELGVNKLSKAYLKSGHYQISEIEKNGKKEKWIKWRGEDSF